MEVKEVTIRKSGSRWCADLIFENGTCWPQWKRGFSGKGLLRSEIEFFTTAPVVEL